MGKQAEGNGTRRRQRRSFTPAFKAEVVALVRRGERSLPAICRELDLGETAVRRWVGQAAVDAGERDGLRPRSARSSDGCGGRTRSCARSGTS
jgi:transposase-like protein